MNYKKSIIYSAMSLGLAFAAHAQNPEYSINGLGRAIVTNNALSGELGNEEGVQTADVSGYNLFDLQTNLDLDIVVKIFKVEIYPTKLFTKKYIVFSTTYSCLKSVNFSSYS